VIDFVNELAPEHLVLALEGADELLERIESAGCVFVGRYSAVAFGDYVAGPSHVLPTGGAAARMSGLSARDFRRAMNVVRYESKGFEADAPSAELIARLEGLEMHARSLEERKETDG